MAYNNWTTQIRLKWCREMQHWQQVLEVVTCLHAWVNLNSQFALRHISNCSSWVLLGKSVDIITYNTWNRLLVKIILKPVQGICTSYLNCLLSSSHVSLNDSEVPTGAEKSEALEKPKCCEPVIQAASCRTPIGLNFAPASGRIPTAL